MLTVEEALRIAEVALQFGKVDRATMHPDGSYESDTTHTVKLVLSVRRRPRPGRDVRAGRGGG